LPGSTHTERVRPREGQALLFEGVAKGVRSSERGQALVRLPCPAARGRRADSCANNSPGEGSIEGVIPGRPAVCLASVRARTRSGACTHGAFQPFLVADLESDDNAVEAVPGAQHFGAHRAVGWTEKVKIDVPCRVQLDSDKRRLLLLAPNPPRRVRPEGSGPFVRLPRQTAVRGMDLLGLTRRRGDTVEMTRNVFLRALRASA
jgi:hypothetical protein